jgi:hypothetical protein
MDEPAAEAPPAASEEVPPVADEVPALFPPAPSEALEPQAASSGNATAAANTTEREGMIRR